MRGDQQRAGSPAAAADDDPALDDSVAERTALLRTPRPGTTPPGSVSGDAARLRSHSAASFSIDGEGGGHGHDAASLDGDKEEDEDEAHGKLPGVDVLGQLSLLGVAFIWGTYTPALRFLYQTPGPPSAAVLTGIRSTIQALTLVLPSLLMGMGRERKAALDLVLDSDEKASRDGAGLLRAGLELGAWSFLGTALQAVGLEWTTAARGAFLMQATALLTPVLESLGGGRLSRMQWLSCIVALAGSLVITTAHVSPASPAAAAAPAAASAAQSGWLTTLGGDGTILLAAFFYSLFTVRLSSLAARHSPIDLAAAKCTVLAALALVWMGGDVSYRLGTGQSWGWVGIGGLLAWSMMLWTSLSGGAAAFLQTHAQSRVSPTQAQVLFATTPLWSAAIAMVLLPAEQLSLLEGVGGVLIVVATVLVTRT